MKVSGYLTAAGTVLLAAHQVGATPTVTDVTFVQDRSRAVTITYKLPSEAAVVTLDIQTNGVSIGAANFADVTGDVNALVRSTSSDEVRTILWNPVESWPSNRFSHAELGAVVTAWATNAPPDYIVYDLAASEQESPAFYTSADQIPLGVTNEIYKTRKLVMRRIHATGVRWRMGSPSTESGHQANETAHPVTLSNDYYMAIYPFTQGQYKTLTGSTHASYSKGKRNDVWRPCEKCSYNGVRGGDWPTCGRANLTANSYIDKLRARTGQVTFDLPTEAQWEFACRAGTTGPYSNDGPYTQANFGTLGWYNGIVLYEEENKDSTTQPVGFKAPNPWGLYDVHGTIIEMCLDWYQADLGTAAVIEPVGPTSDVESKGRVTRGGGMAGLYAKGRSAFRGSLAPGSNNLSTGFRVMCDAIVK